MVPYNTSSRVGVAKMRTKEALEIGVHNTTVVS